MYLCVFGVPFDQTYLCVCLVCPLIRRVSVCVWCAPFIRRVSVCLTCPFDQTCLCVFGVPFDQMCLCAFGVPFDQMCLCVFGVPFDQMCLSLRLVYHSFLRYALMITEIYLVCPSDQVFLCVRFLCVLRNRIIIIFFNCVRHTQTCNFASKLNVQISGDVTGPRVHCTPFTTDMNNSVSVALRMTCCCSLHGVPQFQ